MTRLLRLLGSLAFVVGLFTVVFVGVPWAMLIEDDPVIPWWLRAAVFGVLGGLLLVLLTVAREQRSGTAGELPRPSDGDFRILVQNSDSVPGRPVGEVLGLVQGHTVFAIWLGNDLSALMRLVVGGELGEYTDMMGRARQLALERMVAQAEERGADAVINVRYMTTGVVGTASELLVYGTAVKLAA